MLKVCSKCGIEKDLDKDYYIKIKHICKKCHNRSRSKTIGYIRKHKKMLVVRPINIANNNILLPDAN